MFRLHERCGIFDPFVEIIESFGYLGTYTDEFLHAGGIWHGSYNMIRDNGFSCTNNHLDVRSVTAVHDIFLCQQVSGGNDDGTEFM